MKLLDATLLAGADVGNVSAWCQTNGIAVRTFYRHRARISADGDAGVPARSRRPHTSPHATADPVRRAVVTARAELVVDNGADFIVRHLTQLAATASWWNPAWPVPSRATVNRILAAEHLLDANPAKRPRASWRTFTFARPGDCWQIDGTRHVLADGSSAVSIDIIDDASRAWLAAHVADAETTAAAITALTHAITTYGAPALVLSDNGKAFTGATAGAATRLPRFPAAVTAAGARLIHSSPYHPQTLGKCERLHQTAKIHLARRWPHHPARTAADLQHQLDLVRADYNERHHSAIATTPHTAWTCRPHGGPDQLPVQADAYVLTARTDERGRFRTGTSRRLSLGAAHKHQQVTAVFHHQRVSVYATTGHLLATGHIDPDATYQRLTPAA